MEDILDKIERELKRNTLQDEMIKALQQNHWSESVILQSQRQQQILHEFLVNQKNFVDIAAELGMSPSRVREAKNNAMVWMNHYLNRIRLTQHGAMAQEELDALSFAYDIKEVMLYPEEDNVDTVKLMLILPIEELELTVRAFNCLKGNKINSLNEMLADYRPNDLLKMRNFGKKTLEEITTLMAQRGLKWRNADETDEVTGFDYPLYLRTLKYAVISLNYPLANFIWSNEILKAFKNLNVITIKDLLSAHQSLEKKLTASDFDFIKNRIKEWGLLWM